MRSIADALRAAGQPEPQQIKCSVCGIVGGHSDDCYASETTKLMDEVDAEAGQPEPQEELCGTAENATISMSEDGLRIATGALPIAGVLLPDQEWNSLSNESQNKVKKWFDLAAERLQAILDGAGQPKQPRETLRFSRDEIEVIAYGFTGDVPWLTAQLNKLLEVKARAALATAPPSEEAK